MGRTRAEEFEPAVILLRQQHGRWADSLTRQSLCSAACTENQGTGTGHNVAAVALRVGAATALSRDVRLRKRVCTIMRPTAVFRWGPTW